MSKASEKKSLDSIMKEIDAAIAVIDTGEIEIEDSIATYEHATNLIQLASQRLAAIEQRVVSLTETPKPSEKTASDAD
ncbi:MAG: exodeoxyribonuclease VII small subunit [Congregibacter sp.]|nr:exodeoxyribonuclease VII small subunit [Congregibacter sp.]MDP5070387.1 exodeoxyribonuclease VII small subunit [Congregibacter sp.]